MFSVSIVEECNGESLPKAVSLVEHGLDSVGSGKVSRVKLGKQRTDT